MAQADTMSCSCAEAQQSAYQRAPATRVGRAQSSGTSQLKAAPSELGVHSSPLQQMPLLQSPCCATHGADQRIVHGPRRRDRCIRWLHARHELQRLPDGARHLECARRQLDAQIGRRRIRLAPCTASSSGLRGFACSGANQSAGIGGVCGDVIGAAVSGGRAGSCGMLAVAAACQGQRGDADGPQLQPARVSQPSSSQCDNSWNAPQLRSEVSMGLRQSVHVRPRVGHAASCRWAPEVGPDRRRARRRRAARRAGW